MKTFIQLIAASFLVVFMLLTSCIKDEYNLEKMKTPNWEPNFAAPLINSRLTMWNILNDYDSTDIYVEDETNFLYLVYTGRVYSQSAEELIEIPNQSMSISNNFNTGGSVAVGDSFVITLNYTYDFSFPNFQVIDSVFLKGGNMDFNINTNFNLPGKIELTLPGCTKQGQAFKEVIYINTPNVSHNIDLQATKLVFNHSSGNNRLAMNFRVVLYGNGNPNLSPYNVDFASTFNNLQFSAIFGYLGQMNFSLNEDTVRVKLYDNNIDGIVNWQDPRFYLTITNYLGMPVQTTINYLEAKRNNAPFASLQILGPGIPNPWNIMYPTFYQIGQGIQTSLNLDKNNSNIDLAYNISPQQINALVSAVSNPFGFTQNFAFDTSRFVVDAKVELPMYGTAHGFVIADTFDINIGDDFENAENIDWVLFKIFCENGFPIDASLQIYFLDENNMLVDSLLAPPQQFIHAAIPGPAPDYLVTQKYQKIITAVIPKERIGEYHRIRRCVVKAQMETYNNANSIVKIYSHYDIHIKLGAQIQLNF